MRLKATDKQGKPSHLYSHAVSTGELVFVSAQVSNDPVTKEFVQGGIGVQTGQAMRNVARVLEAFGLDLSDLVKVTVYLKDIRDFEGLNQAYQGFFESVDPPARTVVTSAFPRDDELVKIEAVARVRS